MNPQLAVFRLEVIEVKIKSLREAIDRRELWPGQIPDAIATIREQLTEVLKEMQP